MTTTFYKTFQDMGIVFRELSHQSDKLWRNEKNLSDTKIPADTRKNYYDLKDSKYQITEDKIKKLFKENAHRCKLDFKDFNHLYLPPLENNPEFVPILSMECDLKENCQTTLRVEMRGYDEHKNSIGFGYRFESPHPKGNHDYWHIQVIIENDGMELGCPKWLPVNDPCIPVKIKKPIELILFMLICFYGLRGLILINAMNIDQKYKNQVFDIFRK